MLCVLWLKTANELIGVALKASRIHRIDHFPIKTVLNTQIFNITFKNSCTKLNQK